MEKNLDLSFDIAFSKEILRSEKRRATILVFIFLIGACLFLIQPILFPDIYEKIYATGFPLWLPPFYLLLIAAYAFSLRLYFQHSLQFDHGINPIVRYGSVVFESSIPTFAIFFLGSSAQDSIDALNTSPSFVYFLFIILSTLKLEERMSILAGIASSIQYILLFLYFQTFTIHVTPMSLIQNESIFYGKAFILLGSGFVAGFVSRQIKRAVANSYRHESDKNQIRNLFGQHVSPEVVNQLLEQKDEWHGELRHVCMMFFDIRNFTQFSENQSPIQLIKFLNTVFTTAIQCVNSNGGIINKFLGDGFMAVFGAPVSDGKDVLNAVNAARQIRKTLNQMITDKQIPVIGFGMGLHSGSAVTGNVGSEERKEYTIIGDVVNLASRIEQLNKDYGTEILVSEDVYQEVPSNKDNFIFLGETKIKGKSSLVKIYNI
jgi:adenylate cyclase